MTESRRYFLARAGLAGPAVLTASTVSTAAESDLSGPSPSEYLMRQHGIVHRVAMLFDTVAQRLEEGGKIPDVFLDSRELIYEFTEEYHEELEETYVFPKFANTSLGHMATVLRMQHSVGHTLVQRLFALVEQGPDPGERRRRKMIRSCRTYSRLYRAHAAFEDTDMWPALRKTVSQEEYAEIWQSFHEKAREQLGDGGFSAVVERLADVEERVGIEGLSDFTPDKLP